MLKNMELRLLRYFLTVAKEQSFTKAAEQLHITQPTLSRQMAAFEEDLGITLFIRSGKKISHTDEGILLKRRAVETLAKICKTYKENIRWFRLYCILQQQELLDSNIYLIYDCIK